MPWPVRQYTPGLEEPSYSFMYEYLHKLNDHVFATFDWLNEGHVTNHHRDGLSGQVWLRWLSHSRRLALSAGAGPYRYYDTTYLLSAGGVTNAHDWDVMYSAAAHWYFKAPLGPAAALQLRAHDDEHQHRYAAAPGRLSVRALNAPRVLGLLTMALSYRFSERWSTRLYWYRTITTDGRDSDVVLLGLGYSF